MESTATNTEFSFGMESTLTPPAAIKMVFSGFAGGGVFSFLIVAVFLQP
jgi:hypothetical protein